MHKIPDLIFYADEILNNDRLSEVSLIDHNKLDQSQESLGSKVVRIIDHHIDNNLYLD